MKLKLSLLVIGILFSIATFAQKAKIKHKTIAYNYAVYPELEGYENLKTYAVKITDDNGANYIYTENNSALNKVDIYNQLGMAYGFNWLPSNPDFIFDITLTSSTENAKEVQVHNDVNTRAKKFVYQFSAKHTYDIKIYTGDNDLIKAFTLSDIPAISYWPAAPTGTAGYISEKLLASNYAKKEAEEEGFIKRQKAALIQPVLKAQIGKEIRRILHESNEKLLYYISAVKTKDDRFDRLDSAEIYLNEGLDLVKANEKSGKKGNHHQEDALALFSKAHSIYKEYSKDEYVEWFKDKTLNEEYIFAMASNLYLTSFLTSDFEMANKLFEVTSMKAKTDESIPAERSISGQLGSLKRTPAVKARDNMEGIRYYLQREERLGSVFKERMGY